ncbi:MAG: hypothetical protein JWP87_972 [Labilithrix sp.]|nr:hypothetical protein [Labilithrix sp.]
MSFVSRKLALTALTGAALVPPACQSSAHAADAPKAMTPTVDLEIEDRGPDKSLHSARFSLSIIDGRAQLSTHDGDARYEIGVHSQATPNDPSFSLILKRVQPSAGGLDLTSAIPQHAGPRVLVAKIDRADGHVTSVVAQVH